MSDCSDYANYSPCRQAVLPIAEIYQIHKGNSGDWGIDGYQIPKHSQLPVVKESLFSKAKKADVFYMAQKKSKDPDPTKYSPTSDQEKIRYWSPSNGKFSKSEKKTYIDEAVKASPKSPGPGTYHILEKGKQEIRKAILGKMDKSEVVSFLSTTEFYAEESPSPGQYFGKGEDRDKAVRGI